MKAETSSTVVRSDLVATHPELYHYTTFSGLKGIIETNTLWATHFLDLNDSREIVHLRDPLTAVLNNVFRDILRTRQRQSFRLRRIISKEGGLEKTASNTVKAFVQTLYDTTFGGTASSLSAEPFIASFCSHAGDQAYECENGLLSQWRGYGKGGGFCIIFDTAALNELVQKEFNAYYYIHLGIGSVHYAVPHIPVETVFPEIPGFCGQYFDLLIDRKLEQAEDLFAPFISGATLFKHQGFSEESEVRIVAIPVSQTLYTEISRHHTEQPPRPRKPVLTNDGRRRVILFDGLSAKLPIKRVIVGPSRHQRENFDRARGVLGPEVPLRCSETPFIGRASEESSVLPMPHLPERGQYKNNRKTMA